MVCNASERHSEWEHVSICGDHQTFWFPSLSCCVPFMFDGASVEHRTTTACLNEHLFNLHYVPFNHAFWRAFHLNVRNFIEIEHFLSLSNPIAISLVAKIDWIPNQLDLEIMMAFLVSQCQLDSSFKCIECWFKSAENSFNALDLHLSSHQIAKWTSPNREITRWCVFFVSRIRI